MAVDITVWSATTSAGLLPRTPHTPTGSELVAARRAKEEKYSELLAGDRCRLVVMGIETGGRWSTEAVEFVDMFAGARAREAPPRRSAHLAWRGRWKRMLAVSCARAFARSVVSRLSDTVGADGPRLIWLTSSRRESRVARLMFQSRTDFQVFDEFPAESHSQFFLKKKLPPVLQPLRRCCLREEVGPNRLN